VIKVY